MTKILRTACIATGLVAATATGAFAQSADRNAFDGFYVGGMVGYDFLSNQNSSNLPDFDQENGGRIAGLGSDGIAGGVVAGFNIPMGDAFILGIEGTGRYSDASGDTSLSDNVSESSIRTGTRSSWSIMGRVGFLVSPTTMIYGSGGWGQTRFNTRFINTPVGGNPTEIFDDGITRDSWRIGGGIEAALGGGWTARLDYTYANYSDYEVTVNPLNSFVIKPTAHQASVGVSYYF
jgi:outer membrane immunogenic protein